MGNGFSDLNRDRLLHPTGFPISPRDRRVQVQELPRIGLGKGSVESWRFLGLGVLRLPQPSHAVQRGFAFKRSCSCLDREGAVPCFFRGPDTATDLDAFSPPQTKNLDFRRKWDKDEYEKLAEKRLTEEREKKDGKPVQPVKRELLRHRDYKVDLESKLGKTIVITKTTPQSEMGGYYCNVCDCVVKDSINFLDHINGKKHQRNLGMSMRVERSTLDQVKKRFEVNKKKMEEKQKDYDFEERMKELREEEEKAKAYKKEKQKEKKRRAEEDLTFEEDDEMAAVMGFSGFGSTKKSY